jgi:hypothetical protein
MGLPGAKKVPLGETQRQSSFGTELALEFVLFVKLVE